MYGNLHAKHLFSLFHPSAFTSAVVFISKSTLIPILSSVNYTFMLWSVQVKSIHFFSSHIFGLSYPFVTVHILSIDKDKKNSTVRFCFIRACFFL